MGSGQRSSFDSRQSSRDVQRGDYGSVRNSDTSGLQGRRETGATDRTTRQTERTTERTARQDERTTERTTRQGERDTSREERQTGRTENQGERQATREERQGDRPANREERRQNIQDSSLGEYAGARGLQENRQDFISDTYDDYWDDWDDWYHDNSYYYNRWYYPANHICYCTRLRL